MTNFTPFDSPPEHVNELGVKWWRDTETTKYAQRQDEHGTSLDAVCFFVEQPNGYCTRVLVSAGGQILGENQTMDGMGCKIDVLKYFQRDAAK